MNDVKLVTITMNDTESVATNRGPVVYKRGETYEVEAWIANSLVGRGRAILIDQQNATLPSPQAQVFDLESLPAMNIGELRDQAKNFHIDGWDTLKKEALKKAITEYVLKARTETKEPISSFEPINVMGGKQPPEFKA